MTVIIRPTAQPHNREPAGPHVYAMPVVRELPAPPCDAGSDDAW
jgi:hypothetical protein